MISPTGKGIRVDSEGNGNYGASRGSRIHKGIDFLCDLDQMIVAPFDMTIERISYPNCDKDMSGVVWSEGRSTGRIWYFSVFKALLGKRVEEGMPIGLAQSVSAYYGLPKMKDHIHFQVNR